MEEEIVLEAPQLTDMNVTPQEHRFEMIVGNRLMCTLHTPNDSCPGMFVRPTQVLERNADGVLELVDKG